LGGVLAFIDCTYICVNNNGGCKTRKDLNKNSTSKGCYIRPSTAKRVYDHFLFNVTREEIKNLVEDEFSWNTMKSNE